MWYVVPAGKGWVEIREGRTRPKQKNYWLLMDDDAKRVTTYEGGKCRAVVRTTHFTNSTGKGCQRLKQIPAAEARMFVADDK